MSTTPTSALTIHPSTELVPMPPDDDPAVRAIIWSVCERGVDLPLLVCKGRVVDGRIRLKAAKLAGLEEVPTIERAEDDVISILLHTLQARKHYTKLALAYLSLPLLEPELAAVNARKLANLQSFVKIGVSASKWVKRNNCASGKPVDTVEKIAERIGVSERTLDTARNLAKFFQKNPRARERWEPLMLAGDRTFGAIMQAHGGLERYENGTVNLTGRNNHEKQIAVRLHQLEFHLGKITDGETQTLAAEAIAAQIATWPSGYKTAIYQKLKREIEPKKL